MKQKYSRTDRWPRTRGQPHDYVQKGNPAGLPGRLPGMLMTILDQKDSFYLILNDSLLFLKSIST